MSKDFFTKPFDEETLTKLELYKNYVNEWLPVFLAKKNPITLKINIFDFFSGPGMDSEGNFGSPLIVIEALKTSRFRNYIIEKKLSVNIYFNDKESKYIQTLKQNVNNLGINNEPFHVHYSNQLFEDAFKDWTSKMNNCANLIFLDQFGIECVKKNKFQLLTNKSMTDIIFFISSSFFNRFHWHDTFKGVLDISKKEIEEMSFYRIHNLVLKKYEEFIPNGQTYYLAPFSIKRGSNINGLIFGSGHILGIEKFLKVCWNKDKLRGEANYDIDKEKIDTSKPSLFPELNVPSKLNLFEKDLEKLILNKTFQSDEDFMIYTLKNGFVGKHAKKVVDKLIKDKKIKKQSFCFNSQVVYKKNVIPITIELI